MTQTLPEPVAVDMRPKLREVETRCGDAYINYRPDCPLPANAVFLSVADGRLFCTVEQLADLVIAASQVVDDRLAESRRAARRAAALAEGGGPR